MDVRLYFVNIVKFVCIVVVKFLDIKFLFVRLLILILSGDI